MKKGISVLLVTIIFISLCSGCESKSNEEMIQDRMNAFLSAYNSGDMQGAISCLDAKTRNTYQAALNIGNSLIGLTGFSVGIEDLFGLGVGLSGNGDVLKLDDMKISIKSDTKATVTATMQYQDLEKSYSQNVSFTLVKENGDWYICG